MAEPDLRAEVLAGLDKEIEQNRKHAIRDRNRAAVWTAHRTALRHLREIVERHDQGDGICECCQTPWPCLTLRDLAPDYVPQALAKMEVEK